MSKNGWIALFVVLGLSLVAFLVITICVLVNGLAPFGVDTAVANWAYSVRGEKGDSTYWFFRIITEFGYKYCVAGIVIIMGIIWKFRAKLWFFAGTILASWGLQKLIKLIISRPRPDEALWWMTEGSSSFPSGHSISVACMFILLCYFICTSPQAKTWAKYTICSVSGIIISLVAISRIILGVHYFTDVLGGLFFGTFVAILGIIFYNYYQIRKQKAGKKIPQEVANTEEINSQNSDNSIAS